MKKTLLLLMSLVICLSLSAQTKPSSGTKTSIPTSITQAKIIDYCMVVDTDNAFVVKIQTLISEGWQPYGAPFYMTSRNYAGNLITYYAQAMVKYE